MTYKLRTQGGRLLVFEDAGPGHVSILEVPAVFMGFRAAKSLPRRHYAGAILPVATERALRRIVGLPGEATPTAADWRAYGALGVPTDREEVLT
jgi:hypothetical protein